MESGSLFLLGRDYRLTVERIFQGALEMLSVSWNQGDLYSWNRHCAFQRKSLVDSLETGEYMSGFSVYFEMVKYEVPYVVC